MWWLCARERVNGGGEEGTTACNADTESEEH